MTESEKYTDLHGLKGLTRINLRNLRPRRNLRSYARFITSHITRL